MRPIAPQVDGLGWLFEQRDALGITGKALQDHIIALAEAERITALAPPEMVRQLVRLYGSQRALEQKVKSSIGVCNG